MSRTNYGSILRRTLNLHNVQKDAKGARRLYGDNKIAALLQPIRGTVVTLFFEPGPERLLVQWVPRANWKQVPDGRELNVLRSLDAQIFGKLYAPQ